MDTPNYLDRRIRREIASRKEAERLLEGKSLELYLKNQALESSTSKLLQQVELIGVIMDAALDIVITCNDKYRIETANSACDSLLGYPQSDFVGSRLTDFIPSLLDHRQTLNKDAFIVSDVQVRKRDGSYIEADLRGRRTRLHDRPLIVIVVHDISGRKASERMKEEVYRQLHESRRLEAVGTLASGIAHELNTPIQFIGDNIKFIGLSLEKIYGSYQRYDRLKAECETLGLAPESVARIEEFNREIDLPALSAEINQAVRETVDGVKQVRDIILLMKEFAHPGTGDAEPANIDRMVEGALTICRSRTKNVVSIETDVGAAQIVMCRRGQIQQVLVNLIINAVEAIEEKGMEGGKICLATRSAGSTARIEISDTGPGIPDKLREKIFDPFFTTKKAGKGTGQGLALAKDIIVKQHGGRLLLEDKPRFSTTFVIELPINPQTPIDTKQDFYDEPAERENIAG